MRDEIPKAEALRLAEGCGNYLLFTNRKLGATKEKTVNGELRKKTGVANVAILGKEPLTSYLDGTPEIAEALWRQVSPVVTGARGLVPSRSRGSRHSGSGAGGSGASTAG